MLRNIKNTTLKKHAHVLKTKNWDGTLQELHQFIRLVIARGVRVGRIFPVKSLRRKTWGFSMFSHIMERDCFLQIMKFFRIDLRT